MKFVWNNILDEHFHEHKQQCFIVGCRDDIGTLFQSVRSALSVTVAGSVASVDGSTSLRRTSSMRRTCASGAAALKRKSACLQMKFQVVRVTAWVIN